MQARRQLQPASPNFLMPLGRCTGCSSRHARQLYSRDCLSTIPQAPKAFTILYYTILYYAPSIADILILLILKYSLQSTIIYRPDSTFLKIEITWIVGSGLMCLREGVTKIDRFSSTRVNRKRGKRGTWIPREPNTP